MSASDEEDVFHNAESESASPILRRSTRTSARKRSSTGTAPYSRPKAKKDKKETTMSVSRTPVSAAKPPDRPTESATPNAFVGTATIGSGSVQPDFMAQMRAMMGGMLNGMEERLCQATGELRSTVTEQIDGAMESIGDLNTRMARAEEKLGEVVGEVEGLVEKKVEESLRRLNNGAVVRSASPGYPECPVQSALESNISSASGSTTMSYASALSGPPTMQPAAGSNKAEVDYWRCRRSLRIRPIANSHATDKDAVLEFLHSRLKLDNSFSDHMGLVRTERIPFGPKTKFKHEMLITFSTVEARDVVRGAASNLAGSGQDVGIRLEIPNRLRGSMKALQSLSFDLKTKNPGAKRNILFDDDAMDLVLDVSLGEGQPWRRISAAQGRSRAKKGPQRAGNLRIGDDELDAFLSASGDPNAMSSE